MLSKMKLYMTFKNKPIRLMWSIFSETLMIEKKNIPVAVVIGINGGSLLSDMRMVVLLVLAVGA